MLGNVIGFNKQVVERGTARRTGFVRGRTHGRARLMHELWLFFVVLQFFTRLPMPLWGGFVMNFRG